MSKLTLIERMLGEASRRPGLTAAALAAPLLLKNDDRGYLTTAVVTTPAIFAGYKFGKRLFNAPIIPVFGATKSAINDAVRATTGGAGPFKDANSAAKIIEKLRKAPKGSRDYLTEQKKLEEYFYKNFAVDPKRLKKSTDMTGKETPSSEYLAEIEEILNTQMNKKNLLSNAIQSAAQDSYTRAEWAKFGNKSGKFSLLESNDDFVHIFDKFSSRPEFVKSLQHKLRKASRLTEPGESIKATVSLATNEPISTIWDLNPPFDINSPRASWLDSIEKKNPKIVEKLREARLGSIDEVRILSQRVVARDTGSTLSRGDTIGFELTRDGKKFVIPTGGPNNEVILDAATDQRGAMRHFIGADNRIYPANEMLANLVAEGKWSFEDLEKVKAVGMNWRGNDPLDPYGVQKIAGAEASGIPLASAQSTYFRSQNIVPVPLPIYGAQGDKVMDALYSKSKNDMLDPGELESIYTKLHQSGDISVINPDHVYDMRFQTSDLRQLHPFARPDASRQDAAYRSLSKDVRLTGGDSPFVTTSYLDDMYSVGGAPEAGIRVGGVKPQNKAFFAGLPETKEEFEANKQFYAEKLKARMSEQDAKGLLSDISAVYKDRRSDVFRKFGQMGETELILNPDYADKLGVETSLRYHVSDPRVNIGDVVDPSSTLGFMHGSAVSSSYNGVVENINKDVNGNTILTVKHQLGIDGGKFDTGVKGLLSKTKSAEDFHLMRILNNALETATGSEDQIPADVHGLADITYHNAKLDPTTTQLNMVGDLQRRAHALEEGPLKQELLEIISNNRGAQTGSELLNSSIHINSKFMMNMGVGDISNKYIARSVEDNQNMFKMAGDAIRKAGKSSDPLFNLFATTSASQSYESYVLGNAVPATLRVWDSSKLYVPTHVTHTFDMESFAALAHNPAAAAALRDRAMVVGGGDAAQTAAFAQHVLTNPDKPLERVFSSSEVSVSSNSLTQAENRAGGVFDPSIEAYQKPFSINLGTTESPLYIHHPGNAAYGATASQFAPGEYQTRQWQKDFAMAINADNLAGKTKYTRQAMDNMAKELFVGKSGFLRPPSYDPIGLSGFLRTRTGSTMHEVGIGRDQINRIPDSSIREGLLGGESYYGMMSRQPISDMKHVMFKYDKTMTGNTIGASEALYRSFQADADKDPVGLHIWERGSAAEAEAIEALKDGRQAKQVQVFNDIFGASEDSMRQVFEGSLSIDKPLAKYMEGIKDPLGAIRKSMAARKIGQFSNLLTGMVEHAIENPNILNDQGLAARLQYGLFDVRQLPISARKAHNAFSLEDANELYTQFNAINKIEDPIEAGDALQSAFVNMADKVGKDVEWSDEMAKYGLSHPGFDESGKALTFNAKKAYYASDQVRSDFRELARGRTAASKTRAAAYMSSVGHSEEDFNRVHNTFKEMAFGGGFDAIKGPVHSAAAAETVTSTTAAVNEELKNAGHTIYNDLRGAWKDVRNAHGSKIAMGLAAVAGVALLGTSLHSPRAAQFEVPSSNKYRPEDKIGVEDHIPSEPIVGSRAPSNPVRNVTQAPGGVRTGVVAPMQSQANHEVELRAPDRSAAVEQARLMGQMVGRGNSTTNITVRGDTRLTSLRHREKMRELRDNQ